MKSRTGSFKWLGVMLLLGASGCDNDEAESARSKHCRAVCTQLEVCDEGTDEMGCHEKCTAETFRSDAYFESKEQCTAGEDKLSCNVWAAEVDNQGRNICDDDCQLLDCIDESLRTLELTSDQKSYCSETAFELEDCDPTINSRAVSTGCEEVLPQLSEEYLEASKECIADGRCEEIVSCLDDLADRYNTTVKIFSGPFDP